jgi:hypothetical protein
MMLVFVSLSTAFQAPFPRPCNGLSVMRLYSKHQINVVENDKKVSIDVDETETLLEVK